VFETWFAEPRMLWFLLSVPLAALSWYFIQKRRTRAAVELAGPMAAMTAQARPRWWASRLWVVGFVCVLLGCAGPWWGRDPDAPPPRGRDLYIILDVSRSMLARDHEALGEGDDRLARAKRYLGELALHLQRRGGYRVGVILFAGQAKLLCPLTLDYNHVLFALELAHPDYLGAAGRLAREEDGTASGTSLRRAVQMALEVAEPGAEAYQDLLIVSDGDDVSGGWQYAAGAARAAGRSVHVLGVGEPGRDSPIPTGDPEKPFLTHGPTGDLVKTTRRDEILKELAETTKGEWIPEEGAARPALSWFQRQLDGLPGREWTDDPQRVKMHRAAWFFAASLIALVSSFLLAEWPTRRRWHA
jgi:Ca-activated chloride channel family protein